ncbi:MAG: class I SAM-dependent RNA methyltransferase [Ilumatobacteraceae bacterium]
MSTTVVRAEKMAAGGDAIARLADGRVAFVRGALPGELVEIDVVQAKKDFVRGEVLQVIEASAQRVTPPCQAHAAGCGGCPWQHIEPDAQLELKAAVVVEALKRTGKIADPVVEVGSAVPAWEYRTTLRLAVGGGGRLGLRSRSSHDVIELDACPVSHPLLNELLAALRVRGVGEVSLRVGVATGERSVWVAEGDVDVYGLPDGVEVGAEAAVHEVVDGRRMRISAPSFFQSGPAAAKLLVDAVRTACRDLGDIDSLVDAYGGVGLFATAVEATKTTLIEASPSACADAAFNLADRPAKIHCSTVERWTPRRADLVIADPSRSGLGKKAVEVFGATQAPRIVLVSCDPVSLARDAGLLREAGYDHSRSTVYDLFPQTHHVEVVTTFQRRSTP